MSAYVYRVTSELVKLDDGRKAHVAKYAYKPYHSFGMGKENARLHFRSGCVASERLTLKSDLIVTLDQAGVAGTLYNNPRGLKVFSDDYTFGSEHMPKVADVSRVGMSNTYRMERGQ